MQILQSYRDESFKLINNFVGVKVNYITNFITLSPIVAEIYPTTSPLRAAGYKQKTDIKCQADRYHVMLNADMANRAQRRRLRVG